MCHIGWYQNTQKNYILLMACEGLNQWLEDNNLPFRL